MYLLGDIIYLQFEGALYKPARSAEEFGNFRMYVASRMTFLLCDRTFFAILSTLQLDQGFAPMMS